MSAPRCELTELYVDQCTHCRPKTAPDAVAEFLAEREILLGLWFPAAYPGHCDQCGVSFDQGDQIRADGEGGWVAECCGQVNG